MHVPLKKGKYKTKYTSLQKVYRKIQLNYLYFVNL